MKGRWTSMNDLYFFLKQGWKDIWNMRTVWLFSALPFIPDFLYPFMDMQEANLSGAANRLAASLISMILLVVGSIGMPYLVYSYSTGRSVTVEETFAAIQKFMGRVIGCSCFLYLILFACLYLVAVLSRQPALQPFEASIQFTIVPLLFSLFSTMLVFPLFEFFARDAGVRQSLRESWRLFTAHVYPLLALGILVTLLSRLISVSVGVLTLLVQSGFETASLRSMNYLTPWVSMEGNLLYLCLNGIGQMINSTWSVSAFALAYLKYRE